MVRRILGAITLVCVLMVSLSAKAAPATYQVYLPLVQQADTTAQPVPQPTPTTPAPPQPTPSPGPQPTPAPARNGFFAMRSYRSYNAATAVDGSGGVHLAFYQSDEGHDGDKLGQIAYYAYCPGPVADCADGAKYKAISFDGSKGVAEVQIVVTKNDHPRVLIKRNSARTGYDYEFWSCDSDCVRGDNWNGVFVANSAGTDLHGTDQPQHSFALDSQDRPRFIWSNGWGNGHTTGLYYAFCDAADCTQPGSWQQTLFYNLDTKTVTADNTTLLFANDDKPRIITRVNYSGLPAEVQYTECRLDCTKSYNWWDTNILNPDGKMWESWDLALDGKGNPRIALYEPAEPGLTVGGKLFYGWCDEDHPELDGAPQCFNPGRATFQFVQVAQGEGKNVDLALDATGRTHMVYDAGERGTIADAWCDASCTNASSWQQRVLETSAQLSEQFAPPSPLSCDQEQQERKWLDAIPQVAFDLQGRLVVAYDTTNYARCYYVDPAHPNDPVYSRVEKLWWAVRWAQFPQP